MATPETWENATPIYGIRYPKPTAPAMYLPTSFERTGLDVEAALQAASIPPAQPAPVMVAATLAARDAYWGVPANVTEQRALHNRGALTIRTDLGYTQIYLAAKAADFPGGTGGTAGWYPYAGRTPGGLALRTATTLTVGTASYLDISSNTYWSTSVTGATARNATYNNGWVAPVTGMYQASYSLVFGGAVASGMTHNLTAVSDFHQLAGGNTVASGSVGFQNGSAMFAMASGDVVRLFAISLAGGNLNVDPAAGQRFQLTYQGPI
jgi:hypothetical protein